MAFNRTPKVDGWDYISRRNGERVYARIVIEMDSAALVRLLGEMAMRNKSKSAILAGGAIKAKIVQTKE